MVLILHKKSECKSFAHFAQAKNSNSIPLHLEPSQKVQNVVFYKVLFPLCTAMEKVVAVCSSAAAHTNRQLAMGELLAFCARSKSVFYGMGRESRAEKKKTFAL